MGDNYVRTDDKNGGGGEAIQHDATLNKNANPAFQHLTQAEIDEINIATKYGMNFIDGSDPTALNAVENVLNFVDASEVDKTIILPAVLAGGEKVFRYNLEVNKHHCEFFVDGAVQKIQGNDTLSLSTDQASVYFKQDGIDGYYVILDTRVRARIVYVTGDLDLTSGLSSGTSYLFALADSQTATITLVDHVPEHETDYAFFGKISGENALCQVINESADWNEAITDNNTGFTILTTNTDYVLTQDSRPTPGNTAVNFFPTPNTSIYEPGYAGVLENSNPPSSTLVTPAILGTSKATATSLGFFINDDKALIGELNSITIDAIARLKLTASGNRWVKIFFKYYQYSVETLLLNPVPISETVSSAEINSDTLVERKITGSLPGATWAHSTDPNLGNILVVELLAYKESTGSGNPTLDINVGGANASYTTIAVPQATTNHKILGGVTHAQDKVEDGHTNFKEPFEFPHLTTVNRDLKTPNPRMKIYNDTTQQFERYDGSAWVSDEGGSYTATEQITTIQSISIADGANSNIELAVNSSIGSIKSLAIWARPDPNEGVAKVLFDFQLRQRSGVTLDPTNEIIYTEDNNEVRSYEVASQVGGTITFDSNEGCKKDQKVEFTDAGGVFLQNNMISELNPDGANTLDFYKTPAASIVDTDRMNTKYVLAESLDFKNLDDLQVLYPNIKNKSGVTVTFYAQATYKY